MPTSSKSTWDYWFSINTNRGGLGGNKLNAVDFYLTFDTPVAPGTFLTPMNVLTIFRDNAYGNNTTGNGQGTTSGAPATSPTLPLNNNIAQNAENIAFAGLPVTLSGNYDIQLYDVAAGTGAGGIRLSEANLTVLVSPVPEPSVLALTGWGISGLLLIRRCR